MQRFVVSLYIPRDEYLAWYQGAVRAVYARTVDGRSVQFPANILQPFVTHNGVRGTFAIYVDDNQKFQRIERLS